MAQECWPTNNRLEGKRIGQRGRVADGEENEPLRKANMSGIVVSIPVMYRSVPIFKFICSNNFVRIIFSLISNVSVKNLLKPNGKKMLNPELRPFASINFNQWAKSDTLFHTVEPIAAQRHIVARVQERARAAESEGCEENRGDNGQQKYNKCTD